MRPLLLLTISFTILSAGLLDFIIIKEAKTSYSNRDYEEAIKLYDSVKSKKGAMFNLANSYYKAENYKKALDIYQTIDDATLEFQKLYNMGNAYAKLGDIDKSIQSYEDAIKIKDDEDIRFNLNLLKKRQKEKLKKSCTLNGVKKGKNREKRDDREIIGSDDTSLEFSSEYIDKKQKNGIGKREKQSQVRSNTLQRGANIIKNGKNREIQIGSSVVRRKYNRMLNQSEVHTLMLPLSSSEEVRSEENPW